jgi:carbon-monoxide dehydrogenase medium subunit
MKAPAFAYLRASSVDNALELLSVHGEVAKLLAGGQSLMPAMNLRLIAPEIIIDIGDLVELRGITVIDGFLRIGALTRHVELLHSQEIAEHAPLLAQATRHVAHPAIRNRGTIGGSLAQADPAAELPACMLALDATMVVRGPGGERRVAAADFVEAFLQRHCLRTNCSYRSSCRLRGQIMLTFSTNLRAGTATTRSPGLLHRRVSSAK